MSTFKRQYLPGYTGFVPQKKEIFGCTQGDVNRIATKQLHNPAVSENDPVQAKKMQRSLYASPQKIDQQGEQLLLSNNSKKSPNWIGGPTSDTRLQHIPGYKGYVPGIKSENQVGKSFAKTSGDSINAQFSKGHDVPNSERFVSSQQAQFNKNSFRRLAQEIVDPAQQRDAKAIQEFSDYDFQGIAPQKKNIYMEMPTVGYSGHASPYRKASPEVYNRKAPEFNLNALSAKVKYTDMEAKADFNNLPEGYKSAAQSKRSPFTSPVQGGKATNIPVVGYQGHRRGVKAQGMYGKSYKDCAIQSEILKQIT